MTWFHMDLEFINVDSASHVVPPRFIHFYSKSHVVPSNRVLLLIGFGIDINFGYKL